jgi:hypothetical protein
MNHGCAQALFPLYDLNHVISNISYCLYGIFFIFTAWAKRKVGAHFLSELNQDMFVKQGSRRVFNICKFLSFSLRKG